MNKFVIVLLIFTLCTLSFARHNFRSVFDVSSEFNLIEQLKVERDFLAELEADIKYYRNIIQQREIIQKLYKQGKLEDIRGSLRESVVKLDKLLSEYLYTAFSMKALELQIVYGDIPELRDYLLYYKAKDAILKNRVNTALPLLEDLVTNYPQSEKLDPGLMLLEEAYFKLGMDEELIAVYDRYSKLNTLQQNFWIAQSLYNLGRYEESREIFTILSRSSRYAFKAEAMLALISTFIDGTETGTNEFLRLQEAYNPNHAHYDFIMLSLARLFAAEDKIEEAEQYYSYYYEYHDGQVEDAILYEIAYILNNSGRYEEAITFLNRIIAKPVKSEYFVTAKFLKAVSQQGKGDVRKAQDTIDDMIMQNNLVLETLNTKYKLLKKYHDARIKLVDNELPQSEREWLQKKVVKIEEALDKTNNTLNDLYTGLNPRILDMLKILEQEFFWYSSTISDMKALIKLANTIPNKKVPKLLDVEIARADSSLISIEVIKNLSHLPEITNEDYYFARILVEEKYYHKDLLNIWNQIAEIARINKHQDIVPYAENTQTILQENINSLNLIADQIYQGEVDDDIKQIINEEIAAIEQNKAELIDLKDIVEKKFNKFIAKRLSNEKEFLTAEFESLSLLYDKSLDDIMANIEKENIQYQYNLLGVMFKQTQIMDDEYKEFQEKVKNE